MGQKRARKVAREDQTGLFVPCNLVPLRPEPEAVLLEKGLLRRP
jgi:hypothetical protein